MKQNCKQFIPLIFLLFAFSLFSPNNSFANTLNNWDNSQAYKPRPILLLHGFNSNPDTWSAVITKLLPLFSKYQQLGNYLETMDFQDRTGSVDTYANGSYGWSDRLNDKVRGLLVRNKYGSYTNKLNLVCHSMGGMAAREFLTNPKYPSGYVDKLILVGVPNLGSPLVITGDSLDKAYKIGSMMVLPTSISFCFFRNSTNGIIKLVFIPDLEKLPAYQDLLPGSSFLNTLNSRVQPAGVNYYGIYGITGHIFNFLFFGNFYGGDGIVRDTSQLGTGSVHFKQGPIEIKAFHTNEPALSVSGDNPLLKFLDSTRPEFKITSPDPKTTTETYESSIQLQGEVYKEYLPANSKLIINVVRQEDGFEMFPQESFLKPSDRWVPSDSGSPVAEFDEGLTFPGPGNYKASLQVKNPAGETSDIKDIWVKVLAQGTASIIVHCHNPEGKEIGSIGRSAVEIYDGDTCIGAGAYNAETHNAPITIAVGTGSHTIKAVFNGMVKEQDIAINPNETKTLTFTFERQEFDLLALVADIFGGTINVGHNEYFTEADGDMPWDYHKINTEYIDGNFRISEYVVGLGTMDAVAQSSVSISYDGLSFQSSSSFYTWLGSGVGIQNILDVRSKYFNNSSLNCLYYGNNIIPAQSGFSAWFIQSKYTGTMPFISAVDESYHASYLIGGEEGKDNIHYLQAKQWDSLEFFPIGFPTKSSAVVSARYDGVPAAKQGSEQYQGHMEYFKMSSVPYDLTGSGI